MSQSKLQANGFSICQQMSGFSAHIGPFYERTQLQKSGELDYVIRALAVEHHHLNPEGVVHGGVPLALMDYVVYRAIGDVVGHEIQFATINLNTNFLAAAKCGDIIYGRGKITRQTRSVIFAEGILYTDSREIMTGSGIWKVIGR